MCNCSSYDQLHRPYILLPQTKLIFVSTNNILVLCTLFALRILLSILLYTALNLIWNQNLIRISYTNDYPAEISSHNQLYYGMTFQHIKWKKYIICILYNLVNISEMFYVLPLFVWKKKTILQQILY